MIKNNSHIVAFVGGKGGVGKSTLTANLALASQKELKVPTLLIDLDSKSCGDQNIILGLRSKMNIQQFSTYKQSLTSDNLKKILAYHPTGLAYLSAVTDADQKLVAEEHLFQKQLYSLSQSFNYIFVDLGNDIGPLQKTVLDLASVVLTVVTPEILAVNQTKRLLNELSYLPSSLFQTLLNKVNRSSLNSSILQRTLSLPILASFPEDLGVSDSLHSSQPLVLSQSQSVYAKSCHEVIRKLNSGILVRGKSIGRSGPKSGSSSSTGVALSQEVSKGSAASTGEKSIDPTTLLKMQIHSELIKEMDLKKDLTQAKDKSSKDALRQKTQTVIARLVDLRGQGLGREERAHVIKQVLNESLGLGILEDLLEDRGVSEIMVNGCNKIYYEKNGNLQLSPYTITSNLHLRNIIERIVTPLGRRIDEKTPYVDARLEDGSRVNAIIEPLSMDGPTVTIRKFPSEQIQMKDLVYRFQSVTSEMADFMKICVEQGLNIIISGGTGSGKTTFLNVLSSFIPEKERIITVEDAAELQLKQSHVVRLETRPANIEGEGEVSIRDLIKNTLRMRPDRIVVGECRDGAALDMLAAMNTGHDGSLTTVHSNNPREAVSRLETLCLMAGMDLPAKAIREQIAGAVDLIIQIGRLSDGSRKIKSITEVVGMQGDVVTLQEIFKFKEEGYTKDKKVLGQFQALGIIPSFIDKFEQKGVSIPRGLFTTKSSQAMEKPSINIKKPSLKVPSFQDKDEKSQKQSAAPALKKPTNPFKKGA
ncbi:MAG: ATPase, T2SS/T4P/T4SS family [Bdellovibrionales bacterium]